MTSTPPTGRTTIEDVANAAGVSVATVSRALRGLPNVAPSTRDRVVQIADQLAYRPDPAAARLATGRTKTIAIAVPTLSGWYFWQVIGGAEAVLSETGYDLLTIGVSGDEARKRFVREALGMNRKVDGLILIDIRLTEEESEQLAATDIRVVTIGFSSPSISSVMLDDTAVGRKATRHLLELGHRDIALIEGLPDDPLRFAVPARRHEGYLAALAEFGLAPRPECVVYGNFSVDGGEEAMGQLLKLESPPTAVFAMSDEMAMGAMRTARDAGVRIPQDLSIIGVDNHEMAHVLDLTTVAQDVASHGATAARWIVEDLQNDQCIVYRTVDPTNLLVRGTTCPPGR